MRPTVVSAVVLDRPADPSSAWQRARGMIERRAGDVIQLAWSEASRLATIGPRSRRARRFGSFGAHSAICFPHDTLMNERYIHIGSQTVIGPGVTLSAGMVPGQRCLSDRVVTIGDRCLIGRNSGIVGHLEIVIGDDVWTGHHVYLTDQNHGYDDPDVPISRQVQPERPVKVGNGSWLGHGTVVLPGSTIGEHVVIGANSVVTGAIPPFSVAVGAPARVVATIAQGR